MASSANGGDILLKNSGSALVLPQDRINTMQYNDMCESIRTEHELIGCNMVQCDDNTMQYNAVRW